MDSTIISPLEDDGVFIDTLIFESEWGVSEKADEFSMQLAYDYDVNIPGEGAGPSDIRWMKHRNGMVGINLEDLMHMGPAQSEEDYTYSPKVGMAIDLYVMYDWRIAGVEYEEDEEPPAYARVHVRGQFSARRDSFSSDVTDEEITRWVGMHAIETMYEKAKRAVEERLRFSCMGWQKLPIINSRGVWENSRFVGERYDSGLADVLNDALEDGSFWDDYEEDETNLEEAAEDQYGADDDSQDDDVAAGAEMWRLNNDGSFELLEPYRTMMTEAKVASATAWTEALISYLEERSPYSAQELAEEFARRNSNGEDTVATFEEFVLGALSGDL